MFSRAYFPTYFLPGYFGAVIPYENLSLETDAGLGTGVEFEGINYPFVNPSLDVRYLLADLWIAHHVQTAVGPFRITQLFNMDRIFNGDAYIPGQHVADLVVEDINNLVVIDTRNAASYRGNYFGNRFFIHEWTFADHVCRAIQFVRLSELSTYFGSTVPSTITPQNGQIDERTYDLMPERVLEIKVGQQVLSGDIILRQGYNIEIAANPTSGFGTATFNLGNLLTNRPANLIDRSVLVFSAVDGAGEGLYPGCVPSTENGLSTINNVKPDTSGNFILAGQACILIAQPYYKDNPTHLIPSALQISNQCGPCRPCSNYVDAYRELRDIYHNLVNLAARAEADRNALEIDVDQVKTASEHCSNAIGVAITGGADFQSTTVSVAVQVTNLTPVCYTNVQLTISMTFTAPTAPYIAHAGGFKTNDNGVPQPWYGATWSTTVTIWDKIPPSVTARLNFVLIWMANPPASPPTGTFTLTASATCDQGTIQATSDTTELLVTEMLS